MPKFYVQHRPRPKQAGSGSKMASCGYPYLAEVTEQARGRPPTELEFPPTRGRAADGAAGLSGARGSHPGHRFPGNYASVKLAPTWVASSTPFLLVSIARLRRLSSGLDSEPDAYVGSAWRPEAITGSVDDSIDVVLVDFSGTVKLEAVEEVVQPVCRSLGLVNHRFTTGVWVVAGWNEAGDFGAQRPIPSEFFTLFITVYLSD